MERSTEPSWKTLGRLEDTRVVASRLRNVGRFYKETRRLLALATKGFGLRGRKARGLTETLVLCS